MSEQPDDASVGDCVLLIVGVINWNMIRHRQTIGLGSHRNTFLCSLQLANRNQPSKEILDIVNILILIYLGLSGAMG